MRLPWVTSGLGLTWKALASTDSVNARTNTGIVDDDPIVWLFNTDGVIVANSGEDLWDGQLTENLKYTEDGVITTQEVWTGTNSNGSAHIYYTLGTSWGSALVGDPLSDSNWNHHTQDGTSDYEHSLYGASSLAVAGTVQVTSPGTFILLSLGLAGLSFARYRKQS